MRRRALLIASLALTACASPVGLEPRQDQHCVWDKHGWPIEIGGFVPWEPGE